MTRDRLGPRAQPLLPDRARRPAAVVLACAVLILAAGAVLVHDQYADPLDRHLDAWAAARLAGHSETLRIVSDLGQKAAVIVIIAVLCLACLATRRLNGAVLAAVGAPAASVATEKVLKPLAGHLYPYASYPSGHTTSFFALIATAAVLLAGPPASRVRAALRIAIIAIAVLIGCAIGLAVVALGDHHVIDTVGGAAAGTAVVLTGTFLLDLPVSRSLLGLAWPTRQARAASTQPGGESISPDPAGWPQTPEH
jgi:membrane-associated phospholipid phosphatase